MHRFFLPPDQCGEATLTLIGREAHHALHVVRLRRGEPVAVLDGAGQEFICEVAEAARTTVSLAVCQRQLHPPLPCQLTLAQAISKGKAFEYTIQKATELGVRRIVPLISERVVAQLDADSVAGKLEKWRLIAIDAIKQCGSAWLPEIEVPVSLKDHLAHPGHSDVTVVGALYGHRIHLREVLEEFQRQHGRSPAKATVFIGPEGDFTPEELDAIQTGGARPISLGPLVLRSDTAAVYALAVLSHELLATPATAS